MQVFEAVCKAGIHHGIPVGIKTPHANTPQALKELDDELAVHMLVGRHPNTMPVLDTLVGPGGTVGLVMPLYSVGNLHRYSSICRQRAALRR